MKSTCTFVVNALVVTALAMCVAPRAGIAEECTLTEATAIHLTRSAKARRLPVAAGSLVTVVKSAPAWTKVRIGDRVGFLRTRVLKKVCRGPAPSERGLAELSAAQQALPKSSGTTRGAARKRSRGSVRRGKTGALAARSPSSVENRTGSESVGAVGAVGTVGAGADPSSETSSIKDPQGPSTAGANPGNATAGRPDPRGSTKDEAFGDTYRIKVAVMQLGASADMDAGLVETLTQVIPETLEGLGLFKAISTQEIKQMLAFEAQKQVLGCDEVSCLAEIGGALGADFLITGNISMLGGTFIIQLQLASIAEARIEARISREHAGELKGIFGELRTATRLLVRDLLGKRSGLLSVSVSEEGATVKVDGAIVGVSPLAEPVSVAGGLHELSVEKEGFIVFRSDVNIAEGKTVDVHAGLIPSADFIEKYKSDAAFTRTMGWIGLGVGAAALGGGAALYFVGSGQAVDLRDDVRRYNALSVRTSAELAELDRREEKLAVVDTLALTSAVVGVIAVATGTILLVSGDDPGRYDALATASSGSNARLGTEASSGLSVSAGSNGFSIGGTF
ncbi:MAG: PEGA domain-containing protein [Deltaproteobacteria bacterium]|nr:PEGA domain-containing protein [Deltaproteobacteria bacterium]